MGYLKIPVNEEEEATNQALMQNWSKILSKPSEKCKNQRVTKY